MVGTEISKPEIGRSPTNTNYTDMPNPKQVAQFYNNPANYLSRGTSDFLDRMVPHIAGYESVGERQGYKSPTSETVSVWPTVDSEKVRYFFRVKKELTAISRVFNFRSSGYRDVPTIPKDKLSEQKLILADYADLEEGFDGDDSIPPAKKTLEAAEALLSIWPDQLSPPDLGIDSDGNLMLDILDEEQSKVAGFEISNENVITSWFLAHKGIIRSRGIVAPADVIDLKNVLEKIQAHFEA